MRPRKQRSQTEASGKNRSSRACCGCARALVLPRQADGKGTVTISGELKQWHKVTLTLDGPYAHELDNEPNPFTDCNLT
jgi:hypothetical protein